MDLDASSIIIYYRFWVEIQFCVFMFLARACTWVQTITSSWICVYNNRWLNEMLPHTSFIFCACATSWANLWKSMELLSISFLKFSSSPWWTEFNFNNYFNSLIVISTREWSLSTYLLFFIATSCESSFNPIFISNQNYLSNNISCCFVSFGVEMVGCEVKWTMKMTWHFWDFVWLNVGIIFWKIL